MTQTNNGTKAVEAAGTTFATRTMRVKFIETERKTNTVTYVQRAVGVTGIVRHFALTVQMTPKFWRKVLRAGPLPSGTMIHLTLEQGVREDEVCTYATDFSLAPEAVELNPAPNSLTSAG